LSNDSYVYMGTPTDRLRNNENSERKANTNVHSETMAVMVCGDEGRYIYKIRRDAARKESFPMHDRDRRGSSVSVICARHEESV